MRCSACSSKRLPVSLVKSVFHWSRRSRQSALPIFQRAMRLTAEKIGVEIVVSTSRKVSVLTCPTLLVLRRGSIVSPHDQPKIKDLFASHEGPAMSGVSQTDTLLIERIRSGEEGAWNDLIARYEGRLLAFVESRLGRRASPAKTSCRKRSSASSTACRTSTASARSKATCSRSAPTSSPTISAAKVAGRRCRWPRAAIPPANGSSPAASAPASSIARSGERKELEEESPRRSAARPNRPLEGTRRMVEAECASSCSSCAAGPTKKSPTSSTSPSSRSPISSSISSPACGRW